MTTYTMSVEDYLKAIFELSRATGSAVTCPLRRLLFDTRAAPTLGRWSHLRPGQTCS